MVFGLTMVVCVAVFVVCAFALRARMHRLSVTYEARMKTLQAAEAVLLQQRDIASVETELRTASKDAEVMRRNAALFRLLWPHEYDRAFYSGQRFIAQCSRIVTLASAGQALR
jgi:Tfp pilus assembly protein PilX